MTLLEVFNKGITKLRNLTIIRLLLICSLLFSSVTETVEIDTGSAISIRNTSSAIASSIMAFYPPYKGIDAAIGVFPRPHYWWQAGAVWGAIIDYWAFVGDDRYNELISEALLSQTGPYNNYMPPAMFAELGNDDQAFWGFAVLEAAERKFPDPPSSGPQWLELGQAVFNTMAVEWDDATCSGGIRWQKFAFNNGYSYKNTVSNGGFFLIGARLARYTKNETYAEWATKTWDWTARVGLLDSNTYAVYDGLHIGNGNCDSFDYLQWTYNIGSYMAGAAYMYSFTTLPVWRERAQRLFEHIKQTFFFNGIMFEAACETVGTCSTDSRSFKAYLCRYLGMTADLVPELRAEIQALMQTNAAAVARSCVEGSNGLECGQKWTMQAFDGVTSLGECQCALEAVLNTVRFVDSNVGLPADVNTGTSQGNPGAGLSKGGEADWSMRNSTRGDRAFAWILTISVMACLSVSTWWVLSG
ncbi:glycoside hydrolase family 76 protein [Tortispora caseinolytica NRRL Y-17796]|uniref:Mannan endo-1,6-alpha-mannosidase n=1 Tax=Tortispora caseinolytica NRRL Y-17796 TaxID=767744 RepID=A0A1E4THP4_9ASCO|nr:glycoside hydrolase family 76 protein [Tortispora caseinolytica NRRL Y-17796]